MGFYLAAKKQAKADAERQKEKDAGIVELGMARGRIEFLMSRKGHVPEPEMWDTLERISIDLDRAVYKLNGKSLTGQQIDKLKKVM
jgi:hypothetical protein